jgi:aflatoxin B1 aldehyde reductase
MKYILGSMSFTLQNKSSNLNNTDIQDIINYYKDSVNYPQIDTARYYNNEELLGKLNLYDIPIDTKANPWYQNNFESGKLGQLNETNLTNQLNNSLNDLGIDKCNIFYLHCPDHETDIKKTLECCDNLYRQNKFNYLGISNFSKNQLNDILHICDKYEYIRPKYYQGMLNPLCRKVNEIRPLLYVNDIVFYAYNPLAGGLLTGKYDLSDPNKFDSRFSNNSIYQNIFWKKEIIDGLNELSKDINLYDMTWSWMKHHSYLYENDGIVLGGSNLDQWKQNIETLNTCKPLSEYVLNKLNNLYSEIESVTPNYFY